MYGFIQNTYDNSGRLDVANAFAALKEHMFNIKERKFV